MLIVLAFDWIDLGFPAYAQRQHCANPSHQSSLPENNSSPENEWLEDENPFGTSYFQFCKI